MSLQAETQPTIYFLLEDITAPMWLAGLLPGTTIESRELSFKVVTRHSNILEASLRTENEKIEIKILLAHKRIEVHSINDGRGIRTRRIPNHPNDLSENADMDRFLWEILESKLNPDKGD